MENEDIQSHSLFVGLTRPAMYLGVTITFLGINGGLSLLAFVLSSSFLWFFIFAGLMHTMGYVGCLYDPRIFDLLLGWLQSRGASRNIGYWGCNSYEPF
jgi:type IV secretion system protein VirB3